MVKQLANEIAQSICATNKPFVNYWMHCEFLIVDGGKMSKSLGNFYCLNDLIDEGMTIEEFRYIALSSHYRSKVNFNLDKKYEAKMAIQRITELKDRLEEFEESESDDLPSDADNFISALENDLDSPAALAVIFEWLRKTNAKLDKNEISGVLYEKFEIPKNIIELVKKRERARKNNDWAKSDEIRKELNINGWNVKDTPTGPKITQK